MLQRFVAFGRSRAGSVMAASIGLAAVAFLIHRAGPHDVWIALSRSITVLPLVLVCEATAVSFEAWTLHTLYGADRHKISASELARATLIMYAVAGLMPAGRPVGEGVRGTILSRWTSGVRAAAAAAKQQAVLLMVQSAISVPCVACAYLLHARPYVLWAIAINGSFTFCVGGIVLLTARQSKVAGWIGKLAPKNDQFGPAFHAMLREPIPRRAYLYATAGRIVQSVQYTLLLVALGHGLNVARGFTAEGVHLVGASIGDFIPSHVGATESFFRVAAGTLSLSVGDALAIPMVVHCVQLCCIAMGTIVGILWPPAQRDAIARPDVALEADVMPEVARTSAQ